jgi:16S rRNA (guanine527-N7)-methyltransferase
MVKAQMKQLENAFEQLNISVSNKTVLKFEKYMKLILEWNQKVNLTAITEESDFINKHFIDSILCADFAELKNAKTIIDVGTGAGFPGVPLALVFPEKQFLLIDSVGKKLKVLKEILNNLEISNVELLHTRAEDLAHKEEYREKFDLCVSRAVANLAALTEYCLPFISIGGTFISYKGPGVSEELKESASAIKLLGGDAGEIRKINLEGFGLDHNMIVIKKKRKTPEKYPRKAGMPSKEPIVM